MIPGNSMWPVVLRILVLNFCNLHPKVKSSIDLSYYVMNVIADFLLYSDIKNTSLMKHLLHEMSFIDSKTTWKLVPQQTAVVIHESLTYMWYFRRHFKQ